MKSAVLLLFLSGACVTSPVARPNQSLQNIQAKDARAKLAAISSNRVQLWVVLHVRAQKTVGADGKPDEAKLISGTLADADAAINGGADMILLINSRCELPLYERVLAAVRQRHPNTPLGLSALSYGISNLTDGFRLAKKFNAQMVWTEVVPGARVEYEDDGDAYKPAEVIPRELALQTQVEEKPDAFHAAGVHMKYTRPLDGRNFEQSMRAALGLVDGINITGPKTGVLADLERIALARTLAGDFPVGLASGVSVDNVASVLPYVDYLIVGTSLKEQSDPLRISEARVRELREKITKLGYGSPRS